MNARRQPREQLNLMDRTAPVLYFLNETLSSDAASTMAIGLIDAKRERKNFVVNFLRYRSK